MTTAANLVKLVLVALCALLAAVSVSARPAARASYNWDAPTNVIALDHNNFNGKTGKGMWLVMFYARWCSNSKRFAPTFDTAATALVSLRKQASPLFLGRVDCDANEALCDRFKIDGYPTVFRFENGDIREEYEGDRSERDLLGYLRTKYGQ
ncbi:thioredoxin-like protein [Blastocladiella britannica]|nr:thioredoxin-like protein [Blastocladiella britannica]